MPDRQLHPALTCREIWPGPDGYPWAESGLRLWTREALLRPVSDGLLASWTTGGFSEPWPGNHTMLAHSADGGVTWTSRGAFRHPDRGLFTTELFSPRPDELHAFLQTYGAGEWMCHLQSYRAISRDGGKTWDGPHSLPGGVDNVWAGNGIQLASGRWVIPVSWAELVGPAWAPPSVGRAPVAGQVGARALAQTELPYGADSPLHYRAGCAWADANHRYVVGVIVSDDGGASFQRRGYLRGGRHGWLIEPRVVALSDGRVRMLIRSQRDGWLWQSDSADGGESWSDPVRSDIPNPAAKVNLLRASDGRIYLLHNPVRHEGETMGGRNPLSLWVSDDDLATWRVQLDLVRDADPRASLNYPDGYLDEPAGVLRFVWEDGVRVYLCELPMDVRE